MTADAALPDALLPSGTVICEVDGARWVGNRYWVAIDDAWSGRSDTVEPAIREFMRLAAEAPHALKRVTDEDAGEVFSRTVDGRVMRIYRTVGGRKVYLDDRYIAAIEDWFTPDDDLDDDCPSNPLELRSTDEPRSPVFVYQNGRFVACVQPVTAP